MSEIGHKPLSKLVKSLAKSLRQNCQTFVKTDNLPSPWWENWAKKGFCLVILCLDLVPWMDLKSGKQQAMKSFHSKVFNVHLERQFQSSVLINIYLKKIPEESLVGRPDGCLCPALTISNFKCSQHNQQGIVSEDCREIVARWQE